MYAVIIEVRVNPSREQEARAMIRDVIVPRARAHRGFSAGYWLRTWTSRNDSWESNVWKGHVTVPKGGRLRYVPLTLRFATAEALPTIRGIPEPAGH